MLIQLGQLAEAEDALDRARLAETDVGETHPRTLATWSARGRLLAKQEDSHGAEVALRAARAGRTEILGERHPLTLETASALADVMRENGKLDEANSLHARTVAALNDALGADHLHTPVAQARWAAARWDCGDVPDAAALAGAAVASLKRGHGAAHPATTAAPRLPPAPADGAPPPAATAYWADSRSPRDATRPRRARRGASSLARPPRPPGLPVGRAPAAT